MVPQHNQPAPQLFVASAQRRVGKAAIQGLELRFQLIFVRIQRISSVAKHLDLGGNGDTSLAQERMFPLSIQGSNTRLQVVLGQDRIQGAVYLMERIVELGKAGALGLQTLGHMHEARSEHGDIARARLVANRLLPLAGVLIRAGLEEGDLRLVDFIVEVVLEDGIRGSRVPLLENGYTLFCYRLLICSSKLVSSLFATSNEGYSDLRVES